MSHVRFGRSRTAMMNEFAAEKFWEFGVAVVMLRRNWHIVRAGLQTWPRGCNRIVDTDQHPEMSHGAED